MSLHLSVSYGSLALSLVCFVLRPTHGNFYFTIFLRDVFLENTSEGDWEDCGVGKSA